MRLCVVYYILLYYLIHAPTVVYSDWRCWLPDFFNLCPKKEVHLKNDPFIVPNYLKMTCVAVMDEDSNVYWRIWNKDPTYVSERQPLNNLIDNPLNCSNPTYYEKEGRHECDLELKIEIIKLRGHTFTCHAGELSRDLYTLPDEAKDWWNSSIFVQGASDSVEYTPSAVVEATCIVNVSAKLYPADYEAQWLLVSDPTELYTTSDSWKNNRSNSRILGTMIANNSETQLRVELNYAPTSDDDDKFLVCRCWHHKILEGCGHKTVQLKLKGTEMGNNSSVMENVTATDTDTNTYGTSESFKVWLWSGVVVAAMALLVPLVVFIWIQFRTPKKAIKQSTEEAYADLKQLYSVPVKKSQREQNLSNDIPLESIQSDEYDVPYSEEYDYLCSEVKVYSHIYGNLPEQVMNTLPTRDEPLYAN